MQVCDAEQACEPQGAQATELLEVLEAEARVRLLSAQVHPDHGVQKRLAAAARAAGLSEAGERAWAEVGHYVWQGRIQHCSHTADQPCLSRQSRATSRTFDLLLPLLILLPGDVEAERWLLRLHVRLPSSFGSCGLSEWQQQQPSRL